MSAWGMTEGEAITHSLSNFRLHHDSYRPPRVSQLSIYIIPASPPVPGQISDFTTSGAASPPQHFHTNTDHESLSSSFSILSPLSEWHLQPQTSLSPPRAYLPSPSSRHTSTWQTSTPTLATAQSARSHTSSTSTLCQRKERARSAPCESTCPRPTMALPDAADTSSGTVASRSTSAAAEPGTTSARYVARRGSPSRTRGGTHRLRTQAPGVRVSERAGRAS